MDIPREAFQGFLQTLSPLGRIAFVPLALFCVTDQINRYVLLCSFTYIYLLASQIHDQALMVHDSVSKTKGFRELFSEKLVAARESALSKRSRSVAEDVQALFDVPTSPTDFVTKVWFRTGYYYDKYVVHLLQVVFSSGYTYNPEGQFPEKEIQNPHPTPPLGSVGEHEEARQTRHSTLDFDLKPYILTQRSVGKNLPTDQIVSQNAFGELSKPSSPVKPALTELSSTPISNKAVINSPSPSPLPSPKSIKRPDELSSGELKRQASVSPNSKNIFYKIKIRHKNKSQKHPTFGNYELVRQRIKNCLVQPSYQPDGNIGPNMIRFTWHCCAHYDRESGTGGCSGGTMRFAQEFNDNGNTGLNTAKSYLDQIHEEFPWISYADLYTLGGVAAIEGLGGPVVPWKPGRTDCPDSAKVPPMGRLPIATLGSDHIREVFTKRLGLNDEEIVALIGGGHTLGGCHARFSGFNGIWTKAPFKFDNDFFKVLLNDKWSIGVVPQSGVEQYYNEDKSLMMLNTDMEMIRDPNFRKWTEVFAKDEKLFFEHFASAYGKLLELGVLRDEDGIQRVKL
ncbi:DEKNAAC105521 [Brettanomyces naardenensis]|uniref:Peroxidase n=1 Tax=Brettanomyces naardenensis TaxID=13370 RepID=A0A448YTP5_BRENA|nr:DEKNAAC105521 [Brettanomyces naardenensis]